MNSTALLSFAEVSQAPRSVKTILKEDKKRMKESVKVNMMMMMNTVVKGLMLDNVRLGADTKEMKNREQRGRKIERKGKSSSKGTSKVIFPTLLQ